MNRNTAQLGAQRIRQHFRESLSNSFHNGHFGQQGLQTLAHQSDELPLRSQLPELCGTRDRFISGGTVVSQLERIVPSWQSANL